MAQSIGTLQALKGLANRRLAVMLFLGFSSGLPLLLTSTTLQAFMTDFGLDLKTLGFATVLGTPYTLKFLWAPFIDRFVPAKFLGRRKGWILLTQLALALSVGAIGFFNPSTNLGIVAVLGVLIAFASASQDIVLDAYRTDVLRENERAIGTALFVMGYRLGMLMAGAGALIIADHTTWTVTYLIMASIMGVGVIATLLAPRPETDEYTPKTLFEAVIQPIGQWRRPGSRLLLDFRKEIWAVLAFILLYKLGDAFAGTLTTPFLLKGPGFSKTDVGVATKVVGTIAMLSGAAIGGLMMAKIRLWTSLFVFGFLQAFSNLSFVLLAEAGHSYPLLYFSVAFEQLCGGMGTVAFVAFLMAVCDVRYSATQYALLSALASIPRVFLGPAAGYITEDVGWSIFFVITAVAALPGILILWLARTSLMNAAREGRDPGLHDPDEADRVEA